MTSEITSEMTSTDQTAPATNGGRPGDPGTADAPHIAVRLFAGAAAEYGADAVTLQASTLHGVLDALREGSSEAAARVIDRSSFLLNAVACTDRDQILREGDRVDVLPPFAGG